MQQRVAFTRKSLYHVRWPSRNLRNRRINRTKSPFSVLSNILSPPPPPLLSGIRLILNSSISRSRFATTRNQSTPVPRENVGPRITVPRFRSKLLILDGPSCYTFLTVDIVLLPSPHVRLPRRL